MLGFLLCEPRPDKKRVAIRLIAVAPDAQGKGVGRLLLSALEKAARKAGLPLLRVGTPFARGFYERHDFTCAEVDLKMIRDITRQVIGREKGVAIRPLDLDSAADVVRRLGQDELRQKFLTEFLPAYRRDRGLAIEVAKRGRRLGVVIGKVSDLYRDFAQVVFLHAFGNAVESLVKAFEFAASTLGLRYVGFPVPAAQERRFEALGYRRAEQDFYWTMYTLEKRLGG
jgi:hypothetical protein